MEEPMNNTEGGFLACTGCRNASAFSDTTPAPIKISPYGESDDVRRSRIVEEFAMHLGNRPVAENGRFDLFQSPQH